MPIQTFDPFDIDLWRQFEQVRLTGEANMFDRVAVQDIAAETGLWKLANTPRAKYCWLLTNYSDLQAAAAEEGKQAG